MRMKVDDERNEIIDTNLTSKNRLSKPVRQPMKKRNGRIIISIGSGGRYHGQRRSGQLCCCQGGSGWLYQVAGP